MAETAVVVACSAVADHKQVGWIPVDRMSVVGWRIVDRNHLEVGRNHPGVVQSLLEAVHTHPEVAHMVARIQEAAHTRPGVDHIHPEVGRMVIQSSLGRESYR